MGVPTIAGQDDQHTGQVWRVNNNCIVNDAAQYSNFIGNGNYLRQVAFGNKAMEEQITKNVIQMPLILCYMPGRSLNGLEQLPNLYKNNYLIDNLTRLRLRNPPFSTLGKFCLEIGQFR